MDEINVDVIVSNGTNVEISSPSTSINAHVNLPSPLQSTTDSPSIDYNSHVILPGPQGPAGPAGPTGPQGLQGNISGINNLNASVIYLSGQDGITIYSGNYNTLYISGASGYFQNQINLLNTNLFITGSNLFNYIVTTGNQLQSQINQININIDLTGSLLSANIFTTGSTLSNRIDVLTSNLFITGSELSQDIFSTGNQLSTSLIKISGALASNISTTGNILNNKIETVSTNLNTTGSNLQNQINNLNIDIYNTGNFLDNKINALSGVSVLTFGNQDIYGNKTFYDTVFINNLNVTGTETIINTQNFNVQSPYILLNLTGGAVDGGIFFVTGAGLTGVNDPGPIIGFDHSSNFVFGISTRASDLSTLNKIASREDIQNYSGIADNKFATIINLNSTGTSLQDQITTILDNQQIFTTPLTAGSDSYQINYPVSFGGPIPKIQATLEVPGDILYNLSINDIKTYGYTGLLSDDLTEIGAKIHTFASIQ